MKSLLLAAALTGVSVTSSALAFSNQDQAKAKTAPAPASPLKATVVVQPSDLPLGFTGTVNVEFTLDAAGRPQDIRLPAVYDAQLKRQLVKAFSQWQFARLVDDTKAEGKRFVLPLEVKPQA